MFSVGADVYDPDGKSAFVVDEDMQTLMVVQVQDNGSVDKEMYRTDQIAAARILDGTRVIAEVRRENAPISYPNGGEAAASATRNAGRRLVELDVYTDDAQLSTHTYSVNLTQQPLWEQLLKYNWEIRTVPQRATPWHELMAELILRSPQPNNVATPATETGAQATENARMRTDAEEACTSAFHIERSSSRDSSIARKVEAKNLVEPPQADPQKALFESARMSSPQEPERVSDDEAKAQDVEDVWAQQRAKVYGRDEDA